MALRNGSAVGVAMSPQAMLETALLAARGAAALLVAEGRASFALGIDVAECTVLARRADGAQATAAHDRVLERWRAIRAMAESGEPDDDRIRGTYLRLLSGAAQATARSGTRPARPSGSTRDDADGASGDAPGERGEAAASLVRAAMAP